MKIEILMLKENNERGVRMMFLSLEQLQKLKLNPTRADYEIAYETEVKEQEGTALNVSEIMEGLYERLNRPDMGITAVNDCFAKAASYAQAAIDNSGCQPMSQSEWYNKKTSSVNSLSDITQ